MDAKERLQQFYGERREVYAAISLGPQDLMFGAAKDWKDRYYAVMIHESMVRGKEQGGGLIEEECENLQEAFITANRWYRKEANKGLG